MEFNDETNKYEIAIPITSGAHCYAYQVTYINDEETKTITIDDPANPARALENKYGTILMILQEV